MSSYPFKIKEHIVPCQHIRGYARATAHEQEEELHLAVKQYIPLDNPTPKKGDVTIIGTHANGFPKELYEPLWEELLHRAKAQGFSIRSIWIADVAHQGASSVLNEKKLGNDPSWFDHPRDLFHFVNLFRHEMVRPIVGIGHSMGGNHLVNLSLMHPRLFETLVLVDPVIQRHTALDGNFLPAAASARRRDIWPSRAAAAASYRKHPFYQTWDPRVLDRWIQYGLRDLPTAIYPSVEAAAARSPKTSSPSPAPSSTSNDDAGPPVTLTTTKHQEVLTFLRPNFDPHAVPAASAAQYMDDPSPIIVASRDHNRNRHTHPDVDLSNATLATCVKGREVPPLFYRAESPLTFAQLPHLRPTVLYVFGDKSDLSTPELRADKMAVTGTGVGGSGGAATGAVQEVVFEGVGHLVPMETATRTADEAAKWVGKEMANWREREEAERRVWEGVKEQDKSVMNPFLVEILGNRVGKLKL
ncbi:Alpha/beta hydrolase family-domain-containing protein [Phyllosticta capitalensis]|uniref:Alpha/beta hydrolase family-domain-containing protein n=1 Tax=Phyllosticta capitalensis TaxID=121624 RepID=A0ABR1YWN4_9PEZI